MSDGQIRSSLQDSSNQTNEGSTSRESSLPLSSCEVGSQSPNVPRAVLSARELIRPVNSSAISSMTTARSENEETPEWTGARVHQLIQTAIQPLKNDIEEMKVSLVRIEMLLEQSCHQRASGQKEERLGCSSSECYDSPRNLTVTPDNLSQDRVSTETPGIKGNPVVDEEQTYVKVPHIGSFKNKPDEEQACVKTIAGDSIESQHEDSAIPVRIPRKQSQPLREPDLGKELHWFRDQVAHLQNSIHILERRQDDILSEVKMHCDFTQGIIQGRLRHMQDSVSGSFMEPSVEERVNEAVNRILQDTKDYFVQKAVEASAKLLKDSVDKLEAFTIGQSQRVIEYVRHPQKNATTVFHFYISGFKNRIGSGEDIHSQTWTIDLLDTLMVIRGVATFLRDTSSMTVYLEQTMDLQEQGMRQGDLSQITVKASIKSDGSQAMPDVELGDIKVQPVNKSLKTREVTIDCQELVDNGYDSFKEGSVLIELKVSTTERHSVFSSFLGSVHRNFLQL